MQDKKLLATLEFRDNNIDIWWYKNVTTLWQHRFVTSDSFKRVWCQIITEWSQSIIVIRVFPLDFWLQTILMVSEFTYLWWQCGSCVAVVIMHSFSTSRLHPVWLPGFFSWHFLIYNLMIDCFKLAMSLGSKVCYPGQNDWNKIEKPVKTYRTNEFDI